MSPGQFHEEGWTSGDTGGDTPCHLCPEGRGGAWASLWAWPPRRQWGKAAPSLGRTPATVRGRSRVSSAGGLRPQSSERLLLGGRAATSAFSETLGWGQGGGRGPRSPFGVGAASTPGYLAEFLPGGDGAPAWALRSGPQTSKGGRTRLVCLGGGSLTSGLRVEPRETWVPTRGPAGWLGAAAAGGREAARARPSLGALPGAQHTSQWPGLVG